MITVVPVWLSSLTCIAILLVCVVVLYILLKEEVQAWRKDLALRKDVKRTFQGLSDEDRFRLDVFDKERKAIDAEEQAYLDSLAPHLQKDYHEFKLVHDANVIYDQDKDGHA